ncbi:sugar phosphate isomerase/epimerase family protein [Roseburia sp. 499]|uniref:sugar phosphate isomerase/epimerase family protein n=1 Tax=Roseburia sp. 499 TaxID=1261634 RepID=UPI000950D5C9|nr:sugar phosphate isomerase/epimerase [Roseburia sp. 499]WVK71029.1 sugar phosphate isomerase/epimerase [Roseburia sp. 499]
MIYISDILPKNDLEALSNEANTGIETIEFSISDNLDKLSEKIKNFKLHLDSMNVSELSFHGPFLDLNPVAYDSQIKRVTEYRFAQSYDAAVRLGAKKIVFHTCFIPSVYFIDGWAERMADFWNPFMEKRKEIQVLLENVYDPNPQPILNVKELVEAQNFMLCLDIGHANCYSPLPLSDWIHCLGANIGHVHVHDNDGRKDTHLGLGMGNISVEKTLTQLHEVSPNATYTIECAQLTDVISTYQLLRTF